MKIYILLILVLLATACSPALPKDSSDLKEYKDSDVSVKKSLQESYQNLKKSEEFLNESRQVLKEVKEVEESILLEKKASLATLSQAKKEHAEAEKARKRAAIQRRKVALEEKAMKEATPLPTIAQTPLPYSKSDAP